MEYPKSSDIQMIVRAILAFATLICVDTTSFCNRTKHLKRIVRCSMYIFTVLMCFAWLTRCGQDEGYIREQISGSGVHIPDGNFGEAVWIQMVSFFQAVSTIVDN